MPPNAVSELGSNSVVTAPTARCGSAAADGFRSPATFSNARTVYTVSLESVSASVMAGTYNGTSYDWIEAHPTGSRAGIQLRWAYARNEWHYCTATLKAGDVSALPQLIATVAVPTTMRGQQVIYQACIWHQNPYTEQCSPAGI